MANERATYEKFIKNLDEMDRIEIQIPLDQFEHEARDFQHHNLTDFLKSSHFTKEF